MITSGVFQYSTVFIRYLVSFSIHTILLLIIFVSTMLGFPGSRWVPTWVHGKGRKPTRGSSDQEKNLQELKSHSLWQNSKHELKNWLKFVYWQICINMEGRICCTNRKRLKIVLACCPTIAIFNLPLLALTQHILVNYEQHYECHFMVITGYRANGRERLKKTKIFIMYMDAWQICKHFGNITALVSVCLLFVFI